VPENPIGSPQKGSICTLTDRVSEAEQHNTLRLKLRRTQRITESNASHKEEYDDIMVKILQDFEKLTF